MRDNKSLRDLKSEIFAAIYKMIDDLDLKEATANMAQVNILSTEDERTPQLAAINTRGGYRGSARSRSRYPTRNAARGRSSNPNSRYATRGFCRVCHLAGLPSNVVTSHRIGDQVCTQLSARDKEDIAAANRGLIVEEDFDVANVASDFGYQVEEPDILAIESQ